MASPNYSSRGGVAVRLIVVHTTEGASTIQELANYFANPSVQASSHVGIDDEAGVGTIGEMVHRPDKAWTQANANPYCVSAELCAYARWTTAEWNTHPTMLQNTAAWIAEEAAHYGIPIQRLSAAQAQDGRTKGVCGHNELGAAGGGHWDPGTGFPWSDVISMAKGGGVAPAPPKTKIPPLSAPVVLPDAPLPALVAAAETGGEMPDYLLTDNSKSDGAGNHYACFASGLVRQVRGPEWQHLRETDLPNMSVTDTEAGNQLLNYDRALRGLVKERD
jgi:hypothetical protein